MSIYLMVAIYSIKKLRFFFKLTFPDYQNSLKSVKKNSVLASLSSNAPFALCKIFTIRLTLWNFEQKNGLLIKLFCFLSNFDESWWNCSTHGYQNEMKNQKVLWIARFSFQNFKVSVESWNSYMRWTVELARVFLHDTSCKRNVQINYPELQFLSRT